MAEGISQEQAEEELKKNAENVTEADVETVLEKKATLEDRFAGTGPLARFIGDVRILMSLLRDYRNGTYKAIPWFSITAVIGALLYVLNPMDLIPDFIPLIGELDDVAVLAACLIFVEQDLFNYREWKLNRKE